MRRITESPDAVFDPEDGQTYPNGFRTVSFLIKTDGSGAVYSDDEEKGHMDLMIDLIGNPPKRWEDLSIHTIGRFDADADSGYSSYFGCYPGGAGRIFLEPYIVSFWGTSAEVNEKVVKLMVQVMAELGYDPQDFRYEFADKTGPKQNLLLNYAGLMSRGKKAPASVDQERKAREERDLLQKQHLDAQAKRKLGIEGAGSVTAGRRAGSAGFETPAQMRFMTSQESLEEQAAQAVEKALA